MLNPILTAADIEPFIVELIELIDLFEPSDMPEPPANFEPEYQTPDDDQPETAFIIDPEQIAEAFPWLTAAGLLDPHIEWLALYR